MSQSLTDGVYIVTGASSGFGLAIARELVSRGARVGLIARSAERLQQAAAEFGEAALAAPADVADSAAVESAVERIHSHFGRLDGLVNNAGVARPSFVGEYTDEEIQQQVQINLVGTIHCCRAAIPRLEGGPNPRIVNVSSASAYHHDEMMGLSLYAASKAAVERLTRDLRRELQERGIGVTILRPGNALTEFSAGWDEEKLLAALEAWKRRFGEHMDSGMEPRHVGESVAFCLAMDPGVSVDLLEVRPNRLVEVFTW